MTLNLVNPERKGKEGEIETAWAWILLYHYNYTLSQ